MLSLRLGHLLGELPLPPVAVAAAFFGAALPAPECQAPAPRAAVDFSSQVRPILVKACFACHGPDGGQRRGGLRLDVRAAALATLPSGARAVVPGQASASELLARVGSGDEDYRMPPAEEHPALTQGQIATLRAWIEQGAPYEEHWSFQPVLQPPLPPAAEDPWCANPVDAFVLERLRREGRRPAQQADPFAEIRRVSLDLTGLPATPERAQAYAADPSPEAYASLVEELLGSQAYGERWARVWLDLARYADSSGYGSDPLRTIWRYRDWVIDAYNRNMAYDDFTLHQMAGDLLEGATVEQRLATAFHRNTLTNTEGGTDDEEFRVAAVKDRISTSMQVWMGLTFGCAECHSHKFDPIECEDYYRLFAVFNQTADSDRNDDAPRFETPTREQAAQKARLQEDLDRVIASIERPEHDTVAAQAAWEQGLIEGLRSWQRPATVVSASAQGAQLEVDAAGVIRARDAGAQQDTYELVLRLPAGSWRGLRLRAEADPGLPGGGPGRSPGNGNFVLNELRVFGPLRGPEPVRGRRLRLSLAGTGRILSLAEVEVYAGARNLAPTGVATQSSTGFDGPPRLAIDGNTDGRYSVGKSVTHTANEADPWWELDLGSTQHIDQVVVHHRTDGELYRRSDGLQLHILDEEGAVVWRSSLAEARAEPAPMGPSGWSRELTFSQPSASFEQPGFAVALAVDGNAGANSGWAVGGAQGRTSRAVFPFEAPLVLEQPAEVRVELEQTHGGGHTLGGFALEFSRHSGPLRALGREQLAALESAPKARSAPQSVLLAAAFREVDPELEHLREERGTLQEQLDAVPSVTTPVLEALPADARRGSYMLQRGNFLQRLERVEAAVPGAFHPLPSGTQPDRLGFAAWLTSKDNPLTARVAVNRLWAQLFGRGLVLTEEDFGNQGSFPSHRELLDWLAHEYMQGGWDQKALLRTLVTSATYRQSSRARGVQREWDPGNELLGRGPSFRLEAEMLRDQALAVSGLLSRQLHGPSVYPPQPPGLWQAAFNGQRTWTTSEGPDRYRRGLYTFLRRTAPYPSMEAFDAPNREICTPRRIRTNTPLQVLVVLNDPVYLEAAQALGRRMWSEGGPDDRARVERGLWLALQRPPAQSDVGELLTLLGDAREHLQVAGEEDALALASDPLGPLPDGLQAVEGAAWTLLGNVLLNLDAMLVKD